MNETTAPLFANGSCAPVDFPSIGSKWVPRGKTVKGHMPDAVVTVIEHQHIDETHIHSRVRISRGEGHPRTSYRLDVFRNCFVPFTGKVAPSVVKTKPAPVSTDISPAILQRLANLAKRYEERVLTQTGIKATVSVNDVLERMLDNDDAFNAPNF